MGLSDSIISFKEKLLSKDFFGFLGDISGPNTQDGKLPITTEWFFSARLGQPRRINVVEVRQFAQSPWVQMVLNTIRKEVSTIPYDLVNDDDDDGNYDADKKLVNDFFDNINSNGDTLIDVLLPFITDMAELDAGVLVKVFSNDSYTVEEVPIMDDFGNLKGTESRSVLKPFGQRRIKELTYADGSTILKRVDMYRRLFGYYQYSFKNPRAMPIFFEPDEIVYGVMNQRSYSIYGFSPVQTIQQVLELLIQSTRFNKDYFKNNAIPDLMIGLVGANKDSMNKFKATWNSEIKGKPHKIMFHNTALNLERFQNSNKDMEWLEGQKWYFHLVFAVFGMSPVEVGFHENVNQGNQQGQERVTVKNAIKPYLLKIENLLNRHVIPEILQKSDVPFRFEFKPTDHAQEQIEFDQSMKMIEVGALTVNEYRKDNGREPLDGGDTPNNAVTSNPDDVSDNNANSDMDGNDKTELPDKKSFNIISKDVVDAGDDVRDEAEDYASFYKKQVNKWEDETIKAFNKLDPIDLMPKVFTKTFGEFLSHLMNNVNSSAFINKIKVFVKDGLKAGLVSAEEEVGVDIGFSDRLNGKVEQLSRQQLDGYTINGKKWHGIRGATRSLQVDIIKTVESGVQEGKSRKEIADDIHNIFDTSTKAQAERIANTETNRFINEGKLSAYKEIGDDGRKAWSVVSPCPICERISNTTFDKGIPLDDDFRDPLTGKTYATPPAHPNCKCVIEFRTKL